MISVRFLRPYLCYGLGELAGFRETEARRLVADGIAERVTRPEAPPEVEAAAPAEVEVRTRRRGRPPKS